MMRFAKPATIAPVIAAAFLLAAAGLAVLAAGEDGAEAGTGTTHTVFVNNSVFCGIAGSSCTQPHSLQINPGDTVQWLDGQSGGTHSVTQCTGDGTGCPAAGGFDSGILTDPPSGYLTQLFPDEGTFFYFCQIHGPAMRGIIAVVNPGTPTASPTATPSPAPTASPTPSPTPTTSPSPTPTASPTPSPTESATPAPTLSGRSDVNCDGKTDGDDVLALLLHSADPPPTAAPLGSSGCAPIGSGNGDGPKGDLNCDGLIDARDALVALYGWAGIAVPGLPQGCPGP